MRWILVALPLLLFPVRALSSEPVVATFSIVAMDPETGEIGVAVQSKIVGVGAVVPFARAGVGAIATQAYANVGYGPLGLLALEAGMTPKATMDLLTREDPLRESRQVGILSASGESVSYTGRTATNGPEGERERTTPCRETFSPARKWSRRWPKPSRSAKASSRSECSPPCAQDRRPEAIDGVASRLHFS